VPLPFDLKPGTWHRVRTVAGATIQVYVDEQLIMSLPIPGTDILIDGGGTAQ
jgi:alpha-L-rhamnosidase